MKSLFLFLALILPVTGAADSIYKWTDEQGTLHFSTTPPKDQEKAEIIVKPELQTLSNDANKMTDIPGDSEKDSDHQKIETMPEEPRKKSPEQIAYCNKLKGNVAMLKSNPRVRAKRPDGQYEILGDESRGQEISRIQKLIEEFCENQDVDSI